MDDTRALYLDLLKRSLTNWLYAEEELQFVRSSTILGRLLRRKGQAIVRRKRYDPEMRRLGRDWPPTAHSMIGLERLNNLQHCIETVLRDGVPGDLIETGVWRGGATIFMRGVLKAYGVTDRTVWVADSFKGLPPPDADAYPADEDDRHHTFSDLAVSLEKVKSNFRAYALLDDQVRFLEGWFKDTLPQAPIARLAVMRLDGDMYQSTMDALTSLYPKLSSGGYAIIDDYFLKPCAQAVHDYREQHGVTDPIQDIDGSGAFWRRSAV